MKTRKLLIVLASAALGLGLAGCAGNADASAPTYKVPTVAQMDKEKQVLMAERKDKAAKEYAAKVKAEKEAKAKAEAQAAAQGQSGGVQASSGAVANRSGTSGRNYQPQARHNYRQGKARGSYQPKARPGRSARRGGGGGDISNAELQRRINAEMERANRAHNVPERDTSGVIVCVAGNC